jgi:hypothetical protein
MMGIEPRQSRIKLVLTEWMLCHDWLQELHRLTDTILILSTDLKSVAMTFNEILHYAFRIPDVSNMLPCEAVLFSRVDDISGDFTAAIVCRWFPGQGHSFSRK